MGQQPRRHLSDSPTTEPWGCLALGKQDIYLSGLRAVPQAPRAVLAQEPYIWLERDAPLAKPEAFESAVAQWQSLFSGQFLSTFYH